MSPNVDTPEGPSVDEKTIRKVFADYALLPIS